MSQSKKSCLLEWRALGTVLVAALLSGAATVAQEKLKDEPKAQSGTEPEAKAPSPDEDLLEFLGSWDSDDEDWNEFLAERAARRPTKEEPAQQGESDDAAAKTPAAK